MNAVEEARKNWKPRKKTGKTRFKRESGKDESWIDRRTEKWGKDFVCKETWTEHKTSSAPKKKKKKEV